MYLSMVLLKFRSNKGMKRNVVHVPRKGNVLYMQDEILEMEGNFFVETAETWMKCVQGEWT